MLLVYDVSVARKRMELLFLGTLTVIAQFASSISGLRCHYRVKLNCF